MDKIIIQHLTGSRQGDVDAFEQAVISIGRASESNLYFDSRRERGVSAHHAVIRYASERFELVDTRSTNGTYVNGRRVERAVLEDGDVIRFGSSGPEVRVSIPSRMKERTLHDGEPPAGELGSVPPAAGGEEVVAKVGERLEVHRRRRLVRNTMAFALGVAVAVTGTSWTLIEGLELEDRREYFLSVLCLVLGGLAATLVLAIYHGWPGRQKVALGEVLWLLLIAAVVLLAMAGVWAPER
ncbi:MAG: FHA domain-containing protein [Planctomycetota bacterium]